MCRPGLHLLQVLGGLELLEHGALGVGRHVGGVLPQRLPGEAALEYLDGVENHAGPNLCQGSGLLNILVLHIIHFEKLLLITYIALNTTNET